MSNVGKEEGQLLVKFGLMLGRKILILLTKTERERRSHAVRRRRARTVAWAVGNGPLTRPRLTSLSANASSRSIRHFGTKVIVRPSTFASKRSPTSTRALSANLRRERHLVVRFHFDNSHNRCMSQHL